MQIDLEEVYEKVAKETGVSKAKIELAFRSVFEMVAETMREQNGDNILLPKFGKFVVPLRKLRGINEKKFEGEVSRYYRRMEKSNNEESGSRGRSLEEAGQV